MLSIVSNTQNENTQDYELVIATEAASLLRVRAQSDPVTNGPGPFYLHVYDSAVRPANGSAPAVARALDADGYAEIDFGFGRPFQYGILAVLSTSAIGFVPAPSGSFIIDAQTV